MLTTRGYTMRYGEPLVFTSSLYDDDSDIHRTHLFLGGDNGTSGTYSSYNLHVGPYYGGDGITVNNDPGSSELGKIECKLTAGAGISVANSNGACVITNTNNSGTSAILICEYDITSHTMTSPANASTVIKEANNAGKIVLCRCNDRLYYLTSADPSGANIEFSYYNMDGSVDKIVYENSAWMEDVDGEVWRKVELSDGTTSHNINSANGTLHYIIDNTDNTSPVDVIIGNRTFDTYFEESSNIYTVSAGTVKKYTIRYFGNNTYFVEAKALDKYTRTNSQGGGET